MKLRPFLLTLLFFLLVLSTAHAADPTVPADPAFLAPYLPGYTLVHGVDGGDTLYLLMQNPSGATVFVGGTRTDENEWTFVESTPLPEGTRFGVEGYHKSLCLPWQYGTAIVDLEPRNSTWGVSGIADSETIHIGSMWVSTQHPLYGVIGDHPWNDITTIDWSTLWPIYENLAEHVDSSRWGVVKKDGTPLLTKPTAASDMQSRYYQCTPVQVLDAVDEYTHVSIGNVTGWMLTSDLALNEEIGSISCIYSASFAVPTAAGYMQPSVNAPTVSVTQPEPDIYILSDYPNGWTYVWLPRSDVYGYIQQTQLDLGAG